VSRRGFLTTTAAAAAGYTLAAGPVRADAIHTDTTGLKAGDATVAVTGGAMPLYFAKPAAVAKPPIVLVCMEVFGLHEYIKDVARRLGKLGALAVAPDYYFRDGDISKLSDPQKLMPLVNSKVDTELFADLDATLAWAEAEGGDAARIGMVGFCRGGRNVWLYSTHNPHLKAGVAFYGPLSNPPAMGKTAIEAAAEVKEPVLALYGADDPSIPEDQRNKMKAALAAGGKTTEFHVYPNAAHGFHADYRASYRKEAAEEGWAEMQRWFKTYGVLS
jgi:carboxymethylenebutenolidase